jgi:hypothetical protein
MKKIPLLAVFILLGTSFLSFAIDISAGDSARLDITSRTSFGLDLDNTYRWGLKNELTQFNLVFNLAPYQKVSNKVNSPDAVGFIDVTLFHLDLIEGKKSTGYNTPAPIYTNRYQTGEFLAGIASKKWLIQLNAGGNEPFSSPWNKGLEFINDGFKFSWAYLDSMVDIRRSATIAGIPVITPRGYENMDEHEGIGSNAKPVQQFTFDAIGGNSLSDRFGMNADGSLVAAMYNQDNFGINLKLGTQYAFDTDAITKENHNGIGAGIDAVIHPTALSGLKIYASLGTQVDYGKDENSDPFLGGTRVGYTLNLNEDITVEPFVGLDMGTKFKDGGGAEKLEFEASGGLTMRWPGQGGWLTDYILNSEGRVFPGMSLAYKVYGNNETAEPYEHSMKFTLFEPRGDEGLFYKIGGEAILDLTDLSDVTSAGRSFLATIYLDYAVPGFMKTSGSLIPWTILYYDNVHKHPGSADRINDMKIDLGFNLENFISNTTFGIVWNSGSLIQQTEYHWGYIRLLAEVRL